MKQRPKNTDSIKIGQRLNLAMQGIEEGLFYVVSRIVDYKHVDVIRFRNGQYDNVVTGQAICQFEDESVEVASYPPFTADVVRLNDIKIGDTVLILKWNRKNAQGYPERSYLGRKIVVKELIGPYLFFKYDQHTSIESSIDTRDCTLIRKRG